MMLFNKIRNYKDDPNYWILIILLKGNRNSNLISKTILDKFNHLIFFI